MSTEGPLQAGSVNRAPVQEEPLATVPSGQHGTEVSERDPVRFVPLYHRIKENLTLRIRAGTWKPDEELPSEIELCRHYGVSRGTIRRAIHDLVQIGLVRRHRGKGTYVNRPKLEASVVAYYNQYKLTGIRHDPHAQVLRCERCVARPEIRNLLAIGSSAEVYEIERVRYAQGKPLTIQTSFILADLCPGLEAQDLGEEYIYDFLQRDYGVSFARAEEFLEPVLPDEYVAEQLQIAVEQPVFFIERHSYLHDGLKAEYRRGYMRGDVYRYRIDLR